MKDKSVLQELLNSNDTSNFISEIIGTTLDNRINNLNIEDEDLLGDIRMIIQNSFYLGMNFILNLYGREEKIELEEEYL